MSEDTEKAVTENNENTLTSITLIIDRNELIESLNVDVGRSGFVALTLIAGKQGEDEHHMEYTHNALEKTLFADSLITGSADDEVFGDQRVPNLPADGL